MGKQPGIVSPFKQVPLKGERSKEIGKSGSEASSPPSAVVPKSVEPSRPYLATVSIGKKVKYCGQVRDMLGYLNASSGDNFLHFLHLSPQTLDPGTQGWDPACLQTLNCPQVMGRTPSQVPSPSNAALPYFHDAPVFLILPRTLAFPQGSL